MKLADSNVWLALVLAEHEHHALVSTWFASLSSDNEVAFCRSTQLALVRLLTTRAILKPYSNPPLTNAQAWKFYTELIEDRRMGFVAEPEGLEAYWQLLATVQSASPKLWMDAYLAAFAMAGGYRLVTIDKAFSQFQGLDLELLS